MAYPTLPGLFDLIQTGSGGSSDPNRGDPQSGDTPESSNNPLVRGAQAWRGFWNEHPVAAIGSGFVPFLGQGLGIIDAGAAYLDPEASQVEKGLATAGVLPVGKLGGPLKKIVIGEKGATKAELKLLEQARSLLTKLSPREIQKKTGWFLLPNGRWGREVSERGFELKKRQQIPAHQTEDWMPVESSYTLPAEQAIKGHPAIARYPAIARGTDVQYGRSGLGDEGGGYFDGGELLPGMGPGRARIRIGGDALIPQETAAHELTHAVAHREGFSHPYLGTGLESDSVEDTMRYLMNPGELMARITGTRRNWTDAQRAQFPFMDHYWAEYNRLNSYLQRGESAPFSPTMEEFKSMVEEFGLNYDDLLLMDAKL